MHVQTRLRLNECATGLNAKTAQQGHRTRHKQDTWRMLYWAWEHADALQLHKWHTSAYPQTC
eukprot:1983775-Alexandrium_andersonii.AAC.1